MWGLLLVCIARRLHAYLLSLFQPIGKFPVNYYGNLRASLDSDQEQLLVYAKIVVI